MSGSGYLERLLDGAAVKWVPLGDVCTVKTGPNINKAMIGENPGPYPVINSGREPLGFYSEFNTENEPIGIASRGSVGLVTWNEGRFFRGNLNYSCAPIKTSGLNTRFLYHYLLLSDAEIQSLATHEGIPALNAGALKKLLIPIPCPDDQQKSLAIQGEIVRILDAFTALTAELTAELTARKTQYNHYRNQLLSFEGGDVEWRALGDVAKIGTGSRNTADAVADGDFTFYARGKEKLRLNAFDFDETAIITAGDGAGVGKVFHFAQGKYALHQRAYRIVPSDVIYARYLYHFIVAHFFEYIERISVNSSVTSLRMPMFQNFPIAVPSLAEQTRIVAILDKFDTITTSLTEGLPREIALRTAQYEHYRNLLLSFPK